MEEEMIDLDNSSSQSQKRKSRSRYTGVVPQKNGNWGAQIYAKHTRVWLGTFKTEELAGAAYDSAAIKLRHCNCTEPNRNIPLNDITCHEQAFQLYFTIDEILSMIKDGSYHSKFSEFLTKAHIINNGFSNSGPHNCGPNDTFPKELFRKELTPSDVGKLNRLVIPKRLALKYLSPNELITQDYGIPIDLVNEDCELIFYDKLMNKSWRFKYCYWLSSASFVFTRGWNDFVKYKNLKAKDIVVFYIYESMENNGCVSKFYMIDSLDCNNSTEGIDRSIRRDLEILDDDAEHDELQASNAEVGETSLENEEKGFKLFGHNIFP